MSTKVLEKTETSLTLEFKLGGKEFEEYVEKTYKKNKSKYSVQGFRKGHIPKGIIEKNYGETVFYEDAINEALSEAYSNYLKANENVNPFTWPEIEVKQASPKGLEATLKIILIPAVKLGEYKNLKIAPKVKEVTTEEIEHELGHEQEKYARIQETKTESKLGNIVNIDFKGFVNDIPFEGGEGTGFDLTLGSGQFIPGFEDQLIGLKAGKETNVNVTFPKEYGAKDLAGKSAVFKVKINAVKEKVLPELNDSFATDCSEFNTLEELKESIKGKVKERKQKQAVIDVENKIVEKIVAGSEFFIDKAVIDEEINLLMQELENQLSMQKLTLAEYLAYVGKDEKAFKEGRRSEAERMVKTRLVFTEIIKTEKITISEEDALASLKKHSGLAPEQAETYYKKLSEDRKNALKNDCMIDKLLDFLKNVNA